MGRIETHYYMYGVGRIASFVVHIMLLCAILATAQCAFGQSQITPPAAVSGAWTESITSTLLVKWQSPKNNASISGYAVYAASGSAAVSLGNTWQLVDVTSSSVDSAVLSLSMLGIEKAQTMSVLVKSFALTLGDTVQSIASNIAVAIYDSATAKYSIQFITTAPDSAAVGAEYVYNAVAVANSTAASANIIYTLTNGPQGMTVDSTTGEVRWMVTAAGYYKVVLTAMDNHGNSVSQAFAILVNKQAAQNGSAAGMVTDSATGMAIANAQVVFSLLDSSIIPLIGQMSATTNNAGMFWIILPAGTYSVKAQAEGYVTEYLGDTNVSTGALLNVLANTTDTVNFKLAPRARGKITGVINSAATGKAIAGATVFAIFKGAASVGGIAAVTGYGSQFIAVTNDSGYYSLNLSAGEYLLLTEAKGYINQWFNMADSLTLAQVLTVTGNVTDTVNMALQPVPPPAPCTVSGTVVSATGSAIAGASVTLTMLDGDLLDDDSLFTSTVITDNTGAFIDSVPCGEWYIAYAHDSGYIGTFFNNKFAGLFADRIYVGGAVTGITLVLKQQTTSSTYLAGRIFGCDSAVSPQPAKVIAYTLGDGYFHAAATAATDSLGDYSFTNLAAGVYILEAISTNHTYAPGFFTDQNQCTLDWHDAFKIQLLDSASITGLDIYMHKIYFHPGFARIIGNVTLQGELSGDVQTGNVVTVYDSTGTMVAIGETDSLGNYIIQNIDVGAHTISGSKVNYSVTSQGSATTDYDANSTAQSQITEQADAPLATSVNEQPGLIPRAAALSQNYPNPFGPATTIGFTLSANDKVSLTVFTITGVKVTTLLDGVSEPAGRYQLDFNSANLPEGTYIYRLQTSKGIVAKTMQVIR